MNCSQCKWGVFKSPEDEYGDCMHPKQEYSAIKQHGRVPDWCKGKFEKGQFTPAIMKPCPFCGKQELITGGDPISDDIIVTCRNCGAFGPGAVSEQEAEAKWNERPV